MAPSTSAKIGPKKITSQTSSSAVKKAPTSQQLNIEERAEIKRLASILPTNPRNSDPTDVVLRAASYIDQLVATVQARVKNGTLPIEALNALPPVYTKSVVRRSTKSKRSVEKKR